MKKALFVLMILVLIILVGYALPIWGICLAVEQKGLTIFTLALIILGIIIMSATSLFLVKQWQPK